MSPAIPSAEQYNREDMERDVLLGQFSSIFTKAKRQMCLWDEAHARCDGLVLSLGNLLEQLYACEGSACSCRALLEFSDLKDRLVHKLIKSIEHVFEGLSQEMVNLEIVAKKMSQYRNICFEEYHKCTDAIDLDSAVEALVDCPSIATLLEWIVDLDTLYNQLFVEKQRMVERVSYDSTMKGPTMNFLSEWRNNRSNSPRIQGIKEQVDVFTS